MHRVKTDFASAGANAGTNGKSDSGPLKCPQSLAFGEVRSGVARGKRDEDSLRKLAECLRWLQKEVALEEARAIQEFAGGKSLDELADDLVKATDPVEVEAASRRLLQERREQSQRTLGKFFKRLAPIEFLNGNLPHWRQEDVTYFVTFRLVDSIPGERLQEWLREREQWLRERAKRRDASSTDDDWESYQQRFSARIEQWLDQGSGSCLLQLPECKTIVESTLRYFDGGRYTLGEFVVAGNHVHVLVVPKPGHELSEILHSWKSYSAKEILKVEAASRRLEEFWRQKRERAGTALLRGEGGERAGTALLRSKGAGTAPLRAMRRVVWQKESYDHIVRGPRALANIEDYIRSHCSIEAASGGCDPDVLRRDAAATLIRIACGPFEKPALRERLGKVWSVVSSKHRAV